MRKNSKKYKAWKKYQDEKKLKIRIYRKNKNKKGNKNNRKSVNRQRPNEIFTVPEKFSIIDNSNETISFLNKIIKSVEKIRNFQRQRRNNSFIRTFLIDMSNTNYLTSDALMYLLTIIKNTRGTKILPINWIGNFPKDTEVNEYLKRSGYLKYMRTSSENIIQVDDNIQIKNGIGYEYHDGVINRDIRQEIIDFTCEKISKTKIQINYLMTMLTEMITNISDHAYQPGGMFEHNWYIFVDNKEDKITYTFMDNGLGIPTTIRKSIFERIIEALDCEDEYKYIEAAIGGVQKRSETGLLERGNGLPSIYEQYKNKNIDNLVIISNKAYYSGKIRCDMDDSLFGTIFYWEIKKEGE
mgnify:FL=1